MAVTILCRFVAPPRKIPRIEPGPPRGRVARYDRYEMACALVRESIGKQKDGADPDSLQELGSMLYAQGEWLLENGEYQSALDALA